MHSRINEHLVQAAAAERRRPDVMHEPRSAPPPGRLRGSAALALAALAGRLDRERARRALA